MRVDEKLTKNFKLSEFQSKDGAAMPLDVQISIRHLAEQLQIIRDHLRKPVTVTSGYRSPAHNAAVGGALKSFHLYGMAADIKVAGIPAIRLYHVIRELMQAGKVGKGGLILYPTWVHYDTRGYEIYL